MEGVTDIRNTDEPRSSGAEGAEAEEIEHEPHYRFRTLNGNDTLKIWRMVTGVANREEIRSAVIEGGMEGAQASVINVLIEKIEGEFLPMMVGMVEGEKERFKLPRRLSAAELEEVDDPEAGESGQGPSAGVRVETQEEAKARIVDERLEEWLEEQPMNAPVLLFNDFVAREDFLAVFVSASKSVGLVKRIAGVFGIDLSKLVSSREETASSGVSPSGGSSPDTGG